MNESSRVLAGKIQVLKSICVTKAKNRPADDAQYSSLRAELVANPSLMLPPFLEYCRNLDEFWNFIQPQSKTYQGRVDFLENAFKASLERLTSDSFAVAEEPSIDKELVTKIVKFIRNVGLSFERTPISYSKLDEEQLRDILLGALNGSYEGAATGETFSKTGKTDIHLRISANDVLIAECKFWAGEKQYQEAIDQLFSYLTWRERFGVIVTFSKRKEFSEIIARAKTAASSHPTFAGGAIGTISETHFVTGHRTVVDSARSIEIHHLLFNLYSED